MPLSRDEIAVLDAHQLTDEYERAKLELDSLLKIVETDNAKKVALAESINRARISYVMVRSREYPNHHFNDFNTADLLPVG